MIKYEEHILTNGMALITHVDRSTPLAIVNILYKVGSRNEQPDKTGFAHLFEHLMFGGSKNISDFDKVLQKTGAENNAFTNSDITNYYIILSTENIETALWAEADRMYALTLDETNLENQKSVVIEEFKQRYLEVPYGDVWLKLQPLAYQVHPYQWPTIGKNINHIEQASLEDVKGFHEQYYVPNNAVLTISGNIDPDKMVVLAEKWFGDIPGNPNMKKQLPAEPLQTAPRFLEVEENVPLNAIYRAYHMPGRKNKNYYGADLLSDLLGRGKSSRLYQNLVKKKKIFNSINSYVTGTEDPGLLIISGNINPGIDVAEAENLIDTEIDVLKSNLTVNEVDKVINQALSSIYFSESELLNRSINLSVANAMGNTNLVNEEPNAIGEVKKENILKMTDEILIHQNCSTIHYKSNSKQG